MDYRMMTKVERTQNEFAQHEGRLPFGVSIILLSEQRNISDKRKNRFNLTAADETAAVFITKDDDYMAQYTMKDVFFQKRMEQVISKNINSLHRLTGQM